MGEVGPRITQGFLLGSPNLGVKGRVWSETEALVSWRHQVSHGEHS